MHKVNPDLLSKVGAFLCPIKTISSRNILAFSKYATDSSLAVMGSF